VFLSRFSVSTVIHRVYLIVLPTSAHRVIDKCARVV
jgi:hypothetical protein